MTILHTLILILATCVPFQDGSGNIQCSRTASSACYPKIVNNGTNVPHTPVSQISFQFSFSIQRSVTNTQYVFIFVEDTPLLFFTESYLPYRKSGMDGLSSMGRIITRFLFLIGYLRILISKWIISYFKIKLIEQGICHVKPAARSIARKASRNLCAIRRISSMHITVSFLLLLLLCGDVHPNPGPVLQGSTRHPDRQLLIASSWNVRTLVESKRTPIRPTAIVSRELERYGIDIAALSETRILGDSVIKEVSGGYTFFLKGRPDGDKHYHGVGFAIRTSLVKHLEGKFPVGINERLMTMCLPLKGNTLHIISAYAPTLPQSEESKDSFYATLNDAINTVPSSHKLLLLGDFNARVGTDHESWESILGRHGVGNENSNGT